MTLDEMLGRIYASMPDIGTMADPIKRNPIVQNMVRNAGDIQDYAAGRSEAYPSAPVEQYMAGVRRPVGPQSGMMDQAMDLVNPLARMGGIGMTVYHGSPHRWNQVDLSKVGTGEGAQAYGHGFYSAGRRGVAEGYQRDLAVDPRDEINDLMHSLGSDARPADVTRLMKQYPSLAEYADNAEIKRNILVAHQPGDNTVDDAGMAAYRALDRMLPEEPTGHLYELDLPDATIDKMLDWDAPLKEQSIFPSETMDELAAAHVRGEPLTKKERLAGLLGAHSSQTGRQFYHDLLSRNKGDRAQASAMLKELGIPGIKYYDAGSRSAGDGTRNYVNFSADDILALTRNGVSIP